MMYSMKTISRLLTAGVIGLTGVLAGCGGGGAGSTPSYSITVRADASALPLNISGVGPSIGGRYTTTLYVEVKDADGRPVQVAEDGVGCSYVQGLDSGPLYYLDGDPEHETTETINDVEVTTPNAYRAITLSTNAGLATFHFHSSHLAGPAVVRCSVTDPSDTVRSAEVTIQVGSMTTSGYVSQVVLDVESPNYLFVQGLNRDTQIQIQANIVDEAGQVVTSIPAGGNNLQVSIVSDPTTTAEDHAILRGVNGSNLPVAGQSIHVRSDNGQAQFSLISGFTAGEILIEAISDRADNDVGNGISEPIFNYVLVSAVTSAPGESVSDDPLVIESGTLPNVFRDIPYGTRLEVSGGTAPYEWTIIAGSLPAGLNLDPSGSISGETLATASTYKFVAQVQDAKGAVLSKNLEITVGASPEAPVISGTLGPITVGEYYSKALTAAGGNAPYTWDITSGALPPGMDFEGGVLFGTVPVGGDHDADPLTPDLPNHIGDYVVRVFVTNKEGVSTDKVFTIKVEAP